VVVTVVMVVVIMLVIRDGVFPTLLVLILLVCAGTVLCTQNNETKKCVSMKNTAFDVVKLCMPKHFGEFHSNFQVQESDISRSQA
jgi:hypothetical protein